MTNDQQYGAHFRCFWFLGTFGATLLFFVLHLAVGKQHAFGPSWLVADLGWYLNQLSKLMDGGLLYRDVATPYGPLPYYWQVLWASLFGVSPVVFFAASASVIAAANGVIALLFRKHLKKVSASAIILLSAVCLQQYSTGLMLITVPWAMLETAVVMGLWERGPESTLRRNLLIGIVLGLGQLNKFGYFAILAGSIACADLIVSHWHQPKQTALRLFQRWLTIGAGFFIVEGGWIVVLFGVLDYSIALDCAWPAYQVETYRHAFGEEEALWGAFKHVSLPYLVGRIVPIVILLLLGGSAYVFARKRTTDPGAFRFALGGLSYLVALALFFHDIHALVLHLWMLFGFLIYAFLVGTDRQRFVSVVIAATMSAALPVRWYRASVDRTESLRVTENSTLWVPKDLAQKYQELVQLLEEHVPEGNRVLVYDWEGIAVFSGRESVGRHAWPLEGWVREHEKTRLHEDLNTLDFLVLEKRAGYSEGLLDQSLGSPKERVETQIPLPDMYAEFLATKAAEPSQVSEHWIIVPLSGVDEYQGTSIDENGL